MALSRMSFGILSTTTTITSQSTKAPFTPLLTFPVHRLILSGRSDYFDGIFKTGTTEDTLGGIEIRGFSSRCVKELLRFIYTGKTDTLSIDLFVAAKTYGLYELKRRCERRLINAVNPENALKLYEVGEKHGSRDLVEKSKQVIHGKKRKLINDENALNEFTSKYPKLVVDLLQM